MVNPWAPCLCACCVKSHQPLLWQDQHISVLAARNWHGTAHLYANAAGSGADCLKNTALWIYSISNTVEVGPPLNKGLEKMTSRIPFQYKFLEGSMIPQGLWVGRRTVRAYLQCQHVVLRYEQRESLSRTPIPSLLFTCSSEDTHLNQATVLVKSTPQPERDWPFLGSILCMFGMRLSQKPDWDVCMPDCNRHQRM